jgi:hypothetical protein
MAAAVVLTVFVVAFALAYLDSGADAGKLVLDDAQAYGRGTVEFVSQRNLFLVRLADGSFLALSDLDAANRASPQRRCRVSPMPVDDARLPGLLQRFGSRSSEQAGGSTLLFREDCNGAIYDVAGARLDAAGPNLDRYPVGVRSDGKLTVDVGKRQCTERAGREAFAPVSCR